MRLSSAQLKCFRITHTSRRTRLVRSRQQFAYALAHCGYTRAFRLLLFWLRRREAKGRQMKFFKSPLYSAAGSAQLSVTRLVTKILEQLHFNGCDIKFNLVAPQPSSMLLPDETSLCAFCHMPMRNKRGLLRCRGSIPIAHLKCLGSSPQRDEFVAVWNAARGFRKLKLTASGEVRHLTWLERLRCLAGLPP